MKQSYPALLVNQVSTLVTFFTLTKNSSNFKSQFCKQCPIQLNLLYHKHQDREKQKCVKTKVLKVTNIYFVILLLFNYNLSDNSTNNLFLHYIFLDNIHIINRSCVAGADLQKVFWPPYEIRNIKKKKTLFPYTSNQQTH